ncbi:MAG: hypothetical protein MZV70_55555 [Desulfobacterales bacterium]|nr:hypothetical protein [Desulfobacterales bacterium]
MTGAGGLRLQAMPQADERLAAELEALVLGFPVAGRGVRRRPKRRGRRAGGVRGPRAPVPRGPTGGVHVPLQPGPAAPHARDAARRRPRGAARQRALPDRAALPQLRHAVRVHAGGNRGDLQRQRLCEELTECSGVQRFTVRKIGFLGASTLR